MSTAPWHEGGKWVIGGRSNQNVVAINVKSGDNGKTLNGTMTYAGEGPIGFRATLSGSNNYMVENQWGGSSAPWHPGGQWVLGYRTDQNVVELDLKSEDGGQTLNGTMTYQGEGPIGFKAAMAEGYAYTVENQWGGSSAPWNEGGTLVLGSRNNQKVVAIDIQSGDNGKTLNGTMTYHGEGPIGFRATLSGSNNYMVENQWGGSSAPWHPGGQWIIGYRENQNVVALNINSNDEGTTLNGTMTYQGEGPIGFKGSLM
ncbi:hypothetical protein [Lyngbya sp. PCC 8106]|uniref:lectin OAA family protein n=1 Tax=Lyngbya sp. (strain PCC 8106) TaxID=313612 RepID=UPI0000EA9B26|nr:hypothetical protein [Lyngbya sp. PCC 8106]EAW35857.1 hypothetical protein L8106_02742 [Lyngbya sp. PCC 8106]